LKLFGRKIIAALRLMKLTAAIFLICRETDKTNRKDDLSFDSCGFAEF